VACLGLLGVTFPFLAYYADFFGLWPLRPAAERARSADPARRGGQKWQDDTLDHRG
jgi:hypothetical protein